MNNIEKHRLLLLVGSSYRSVNLGGYLSRELARLIGKEISILSAFYKVADPMFPLKVGDELMNTPADSEPDEKMEFAFDVALYQPQIIEAKSVLEALHQFSTLVEGIVTALTPRLRGTP